MTAFEDLGLLRAFTCIVECGSISAASRRLKTSQPTLSRHLKELEERCGAALLRRDTHRMSLTETGHRLLADAQAMLARAEEADHRLREGQTTLSGHLRVFATIDWGQWVVTRLLSQFLQAHPRVTAGLALTNRPLHMIQEGCDVGILPGMVTDESAVARLAGTITLQLVATPALVGRMPPARTPADLKAWPWISLAGSQFWSARDIRLTAKNRTEQTLRVSPVLVSEGVTSVREATLTGLGISLLPDWLVRDELSAGHLVRVLPKWRARDLPVHVVYSGQRALPARVRAFVEFALKAMKPELQAGPAQAAAR